MVAASDWRASAGPARLEGDSGAQASAAEHPIEGRRRMLKRVARRAELHSERGGPTKKGVCVKGVAAGLISGYISLWPGAASGSVRLLLCVFCLTSECVRGP